MRGLLAAQEVEAWAAGLWIGRFKVTLIKKLLVCVKGVYRRRFFRKLYCETCARASPGHSGQCLLLGGLCLVEFNKPLLASCLRCAQACACVLGWGAGPSPNPCTGAFCTGAHYTACRFRGRIPPPEWHRRPCPAGRFRAIPRVRRTGRPVNTPHPRWAVWQPSQTLACAMCKTGT